MLLGVLAAVAAGAGVFAVTRAGGAPGPPAPTITSASVPQNGTTTQRSAAFTFSEAYGSNISMGPQAMQGDLKATAGDWLNVGWQVNYSGNHAASTVTFDNNTITHNTTASTSTHVRMLDSGTDQDACQGATLTIDWTSN